MASGTAHRWTGARSDALTGCRVHSPAVSESGASPSSPNPTTPGPTGPGWYNDPAGRFEFRYHNGTMWTSDVASNGQRYVDPVAPGGGPPLPYSTPPGQADNGSRNGIAVAALVCGIVSVVLGWIPVLFAIGAVLAVLAIIFGIVGFRRSRTSGRRRGFAITGLITGSIGLLVAVVGLVFTIALFRASDRYENPPDSSLSIESCVVEAGRARAEGELRNDGVRSSRFTVHIEFRAVPSGPSIERLVSVRSTPPGETTRFVAVQRLDADEVECEITAVNGPLPLGIEFD
jgi:hypothetical protein